MEGVADVVVGAVKAGKHNVADVADIIYYYNIEKSPQKTKIRIKLTRNKNIKQLQKLNRK